MQAAGGAAVSGDRPGVRTAAEAAPLLPKSCRMASSRARGQCRHSSGRARRIFTSVSGRSPLSVCRQGDGGRASDAGQRPLVHMVQPAYSPSPLQLVRWEIPSSSCERRRKRGLAVPQLLPACRHNSRSPTLRPKAPCTGTAVRSSHLHVVQALDHVHAAADSTKDGVLAIQPCRRKRGLGNGWGAGHASCMLRAAQIASDKGRRR